MKTDISRKDEAIVERKVGGEREGDREKIKSVRN